jgi:hypothetical protein
MKRRGSGKDMSTLKGEHLVFGLTEYVLEIIAM